MNEEDHQSEKY